MSAAPILTASHETEFAAKRARLERSELSGGCGYIYGEGIEEPSRLGSEESMERSMEKLRECFPQLSEGLLASILESTGGKLEMAQYLVGQISATKTERLSSGKRRRSSSPSAENAGRTSKGGLRLDSWAWSVVKALRSAPSQEEGCRRLMGAAEELLAQKTGEAVGTQKLLSRAVLSQVNKINKLRIENRSQQEEFERLREKVFHLESERDTLVNRVGVLESANRQLSYFLATTYGNDGSFGAGGGGAGSSSSSSGGHGIY